MNYHIYAYVFDDGMTYIGLTRQKPKIRHRQHKHVSHTGFIPSSAFRYSVQSNMEFPEMLILESGLTVTEAKRLESVYVNAIDPEKRLNTASTGIQSSSTGWPEDKIVLTPEQRAAKAREYVKRSNLKNAEKVRERNRLYAERNHEKIKARNREYMSRKRKLLGDVYREYYRKYWKNRRIKKLAMEFFLKPLQIKLLEYLQKKGKIHERCVSTCTGLI